MTRTRQRTSAGPAQVAESARDARQWPWLARHQPHDLAAFGPGGDRTAAQLRADVARLSAHLPPATPGSHVALICGDRYRFAVALLACWQRGHAVALPPNGRPETVAEVCDRSEVLELLHDTDALRGRDLRVWPGDAAPGPGDFALDAQVIDLTADRTLATVFTSGSTGASVPCGKTARQLLSEVETLQTTFGIGPGQRLVATVPPHHIYGLLFSVLLPLHSGAAFCRDTPLHAETIAAYVRDHQATLLVSVPAHLATFAVLQPDSFPGVARLFSSTAPLPATTANALWTRQGLEITELFGSSETGGIAWRQGGEAQPWRPLDGVTVQADATGHLLVDSPHLDPRVARPLRTEDRIRMHGPTAFEHLGRVDGVVKSGGKRLALAQLEARLLALPGVLDAAVVAVASAQAARSVEVLAAVVAPAWTAARLRAALLDWFEPSSLPRRLVLCPALPREDSGKLTRAKLLGLFGKTELAAESPRELEQLAYAPPAEPTGDHQYRLRVPENLYYFHGHFPMLPILPGIAELYAIVLPRVRDLRPDWTQLGRISRLKFRRTLHPNDVLDLRLTFRDAKQQVDFTLVRGQEPCASGLLSYKTDLDRQAG